MQGRDGVIFGGGEVDVNKMLMFLPSVDKSGEIVYNTTECRGPFCRVETRRRPSQKGDYRMTLVILAAGMGSRYGGLKQIDPLGKNGEFIIDFSVFDAIRAGFTKVVFVIKEENLAVFRETVGKRIEPHVKVEYVFQDLHDLPSGHTCPAGRTKPFGTAHALLAARNVVSEPFAVINADDFYGGEAYRLLASHLSAAKNGEYCMVGYRLKNTLTENGSVSRGECRCDEEGYLLSVTERTRIFTEEGGRTVYVEDEVSHPIADSTVVSMNCWGFTPEIFASVARGFEGFLSKDEGDPMKREYYLPFAVQEMLDEKKCTVRVFETDAKWYGVTYHEDKESVQVGIAALTDAGEYPEPLFS